MPAVVTMSAAANAAAYFLLKIIEIPPFPVLKLSNPGGLLS